MLELGRVDDDEVVARLVQLLHVPYNIHGLHVVGGAADKGIEPSTRACKMGALTNKLPGQGQCGEVFSSCKPSYSNSQSSPIANLATRVLECNLRFRDYV